MEVKEKVGKELRHLMPKAAAFVDSARAALGAAYVDAQIAQSVRLQRAVEAIRQRDGQAAADEYLKANRDQATFFFNENGHTVGISTTAVEHAYPYEGGFIPDEKKKIHQRRR